MLGRVQVQAHHVQQLVLEARIARELEGAAQVRLQAVALPDAADGRRTNTQMVGQRAGAPVRGVDRLAMQRGLHDARFHLRRDRDRPTCARNNDRSPSGTRVDAPSARELCQTYRSSDSDYLGNAHCAEAATCEIRMLLGNLLRPSPETPPLPERQPQNIVITSVSLFPVRSGLTSLRGSRSSFCCEVNRGTWG